MSDESRPAASALLTEAPTITKTVVMSEGRIPTMLGESMDRMLEVSEAVAIVTVVAYEDLTYSLEYVPPENIFDEPGTYPVLERGEPGYVPTLARFTIQVEALIHGQLNYVDEEKGTTHLLQLGGYVDSTAFHAEDAQLVEIGKTYLLFLVPGPRCDSCPDNSYHALSFGMYEIDGGRLSAMTIFTHLQVVKELDRSQLSAATEAIESRAGLLDSLNLREQSDRWAPEREGLAFAQQVTQGTAE